MSTKHGLRALVGLALAGTVGCTMPFGLSGSVANDFPAPPAGKGLQLTVAPFDVPPGTEVQKDFYFKLPSDQDWMITKVEYHLSPGSHHCSLFKSDTQDLPDRVDTTFDAIDYGSYDMWAASQAPDAVITYPAGNGLRLKAHQQLCFQAHWVNGVGFDQNTPTGKADIKVNVWGTPLAPGASSSLGTVGMMFGINKTLTIPPNTPSYVATKSVTFPADKFPNGADIFAMSGHFHAHGKAFTVYQCDDGGATISPPVYVSRNWNEPPYATYSTPIHVKPGGKFYYYCEYVNNSTASIPFGPHVLTQEHANLFMWFTPGPADGRAFYDFASTL